MTELFFILLIAGVMLVGAEIFIPGGILGVMGGLALFGAVITAFNQFPTSVATMITAGIVIMLGIVTALWIKLFPKTWIGKQMMVSQDLHEAKGTEPGLEQLVDKQGVATSSLHPGGFATIDGHRFDVITQGEMIDSGTPIRVIEVEGNRIVVEQTELESH